MTVYEKKVNEMDKAVAKAFGAKNKISALYWAQKAKTAKRSFCNFVETSSVNSAAKNI